MCQRAPLALFVAALAASALLLFSLVSHLTFVGDGWELLAGRPDWTADTFLRPFNEHPIVIPALIYKFLLTLFGMDSALPFYAVSISLYLLCAVLLFVYMRRRIGDWGALGGALLLLFLGAAYEDLLWEFQMGFFGSIAVGMGALLALEREDRPGDAMAAALLVIATAFSTLGVPFICAALTHVLLGPRPRRRRLYVPLLPLAAYAIWWLISGHAAGGQIGLDDIPRLPAYVFEVAGAGIASLLGQQPIGSEGQPPLLGKVLALFLAAILAYRLMRWREIPPGLKVALVLLFSFWLLIALDRGPQRFSSRFQYPTAAFLLVVAAEALRDQRLSRPARFVLAATIAGAVVGGISLLHQGYANIWKPTADQIRVSLGVIDIAGVDADPRYAISLPPSIFLPVAKYRTAEHKHGSPAFSETQLLEAGEAEKATGDLTLVAATGLRLGPPREPRSLVRCRPVGPAPAIAEATLARAGTFQLENPQDRRVLISLGRFSRTTPAQLGALPGHASRSLRIRPDGSPRSWRLGVLGGSVRLCGVR